MHFSNPLLQTRGLGKKSQKNDNISLFSVYSPFLECFIVADKRHYALSLSLVAVCSMHVFFRTLKLLQHPNLTYSPGARVTRTVCKRLELKIIILGIKVRRSCYFKHSTFRMRDECAICSGHIFPVGQPKSNCVSNHICFLAKVTLLLKNNIQSSYAYLLHSKSHHYIKKVTIHRNFIPCHICFFLGVFRPTRKIFTHMEHCL